jgi:hypothetical protein
MDELRSPNGDDIVDGLRLGLLLNIDTGNLTVYKNGVRLGVAATGLPIANQTNKLCWAVVMHSQNTQVRISTPPVPDFDHGQEAAEAAELCDMSDEEYPIGS